MMVPSVSYSVGSQCIEDDCGISFIICYCVGRCPKLESSGLFPVEV